MVLLHRELPSKRGSWYAVMVVYTYALFATRAAEENNSDRCYHEGTMQTYYIFIL